MPGGGFGGGSFHEPIQQPTNSFSSLATQGPGQPSAKTTRTLFLVHSPRKLRIQPEIKNFCGSPWLACMLESFSAKEDVSQKRRGSCQTETNTYLPPSGERPRLLTLVAHSEETWRRVQENRACAPPLQYSYRAGIKPLLFGGPCSVCIQRDIQTTVVWLEAREAPQSNLQNPYNSLSKSIESHKSDFRVTSCRVL